MILFFIALDNVVATGDFNEGGSVKSAGVKGVLLSDNHFLFSWIDDPHRKMVKLKNDGALVTDAYISKDEVDWMDETKWLGKDGGTFSITAFKGFPGIPLDDKL